MKENLEMDSVTIKEVQQRCVNRSLWGKQMSHYNTSGNFLLVTRGAAKRDIWTSGFGNEPCGKEKLQRRWEHSDLGLCLIVLPGKLSEDNETNELP